MTTKLGFWPSASEAFALAARASSLVATTRPKRRASSTMPADRRASAPPRQDWVLRSGIFIELQGLYAPREEKPPSGDGVALRKPKSRSGRAEFGGGFAEVFDRRGRRFAAFEFLAVPVDPDHRDVHFEHRGDVGRVVAADVEPAFFAADAAGALFEVDRVRLVAADLLGGDDEVEFGAQVAPRDPQKFVVDVGDDPDLVLFAEPVHRRVGLAEGQPVGDAVG